jgi:hypothetical protein
MWCYGVLSGAGDIALDVEATNQGTNTSAIDAGSLVTTAATVSFMGVGEYTHCTYTEGSGWTKDLDSEILAQSRADASGTLDPAATASLTMDWSACAASFKETSGSSPGSGSDLSAVGVSESSSNLIRVTIVEETS